MAPINIFWLLFTFVLVSCAGIRSRYHEVTSGETLGAIAKRYGVSVQGIQYHNENLLEEGLHEGTKLYIPFEENPEWNADFVPQGGDERDPDSEATAATADFSWPVPGAVSSQFGKRKRRSREAMHEGIDISARHGTPVRAARSGHVIYASNRIRGYGNMIIIRHADTYSTVYAHLSKIQVKKGQFVGRGQLIGKVGQTGRAHGPHLHFEIRDRQTPVDPLQYLPGQYANN